MDEAWEEVGRLPLPPSGPQAIVQLSSTFAFDTSQELLWVGNQFGRVWSFYSTELQRYTSFKCGDGPVRQLLFHEKGVIALCPRSVHMALRRGPPIWHIVHEDMKDLQCMSFTSRGNTEILVAGLQDRMFVIDAEKGTITRQIPSIDHYTIMKRSRYICAATGSGEIHLLDPKTFELQETKFKAHALRINDMDAQHDFVVTCGYAMRQGQIPMLDPMVNAFDLKNLKQMHSVSFPSGAAYVRLHPRLSSTIIIVSQYGQIHEVDLLNPDSSKFKQANVLTYLSMIEMAPSGEALVLADGECNLHLWGSRAKIRFAEISNPVEFADPEEPALQVDWNNETPLSTVGMPYYRENLLSAWPSHLIHEVGAPPPKFDPQFLSKLSMGYGGYYGRVSATMRRNQVEDTRAVEKAPINLTAPRFLSEKARENQNNTVQERRISDVAEALGAIGLKSEVPMIYRNVEIKYSKFGIDDFDFGFYNHTLYSGLETHISNSYANSLLQVLHKTPMIRNLALQHTSSICVSDMCLLCEMGFLFDMLEKAQGNVCQATNLLKTFSSNPLAAQHRLLEEDAPTSSLTEMLQKLNRFFLERMAHDWRGLTPHNPQFEQIMSTSMRTTVRCTKLMVRNARPPRPSFSEILKQSIEHDETSRGWCIHCQRHQPLATRKTIHNAPPVLLLNAAVKSPEAKQYWSIPGWLPEEIGIIIQEGQFFCYERDDLKSLLQRRQVEVYSLIGFAAEIDSGQHQKPHLVSLINVAHSQPVAPGESQWHLFNDFLVHAVKTEDALTFYPTWKLPSVIAYQNKRFINKIDHAWKQHLDIGLLYGDHNRNLGEKTYRVLSPQEAPGEGTIIALDTEFVAIRQPEIEVNADGARETIRPKVHALARVSVVRGSGEDEGLPFIDDYIISKEPIVDYLTSYSGIVQADLDPKLSKRNLIPLKIAYKKLWILLNLGCKFLGHGLKQDFRVTNIHIPKAQIIDTIEIFYKSAFRRKLSLAFLAWKVLNEDIQQGTHDSIEDARTALKLYKKYLEFQDAGILETMLQDIYREGTQVQFKPPPPKKDGHLIERTETPPITSGGHLAGTPGPASGPTTPVRRPLGLAPGSSSTFSGGWTPGKGTNNLGGSPLR
ncbi:related to PAN2-component of Pab1p-stimulated poly(A) ribonuclease [Phialocephala subalpina]|uniref:PAN2-PAN3 deadenylation complex catalytic subunit PAN2 n=1 Tax=Phialocephala subalpina TaxID=576137 RepID=A0A1L7WGP9_9HELO|nr:related to PAN2-component of Pab1p-stimulated poly(A) ribonuclease [Phialocephala subalpina]